MIGEHCGTPLARFTSDRAQDLWKVAMWRCPRCHRTFKQRLRRAKKNGRAVQQPQVQ